MSIENTASPDSATTSSSREQGRLSAMLEWLRLKLETMPDERTFTWTSLSLLLGFWFLFIIYIQFPAKLNFDEFHYIPSARQFLDFVENRNYEHPPLGKELIALGMGIFGDRPIGWRFMSTLFGALTVVGTYVAGAALFRTQLSALFIALMTGFNNLVYVQARIAMLDTFMMAFLIWAFALGLCAFFPLHASPTTEQGRSQRLKNLDRSGIALGLACACKWFAIIPWATLIGVGALYRLMRAWSVRFDSPRSKTALPAFFPLEQEPFSLRELLRAWFFIPIAAYYATFIPFLWIIKNDGNAFTVRDILVRMQWRMWDGQLRVVSPHPYSSSWLQWPLMTRPIWYAFDASPDKQSVRGVALIGNPLVLWGGLVAMAWTLWDWLRARTFAGFWILATYASMTFSWALIPRKIAFFYYYYPSAILLSFAWAYVLQRNSEDLEPEDSPQLPLVLHLIVLAGTLALFVYFLPILSAWKIPFSEYRSWMWFRSWI